MNTCPSRSNPADDEPDYSEKPWLVSCPKCKSKRFAYDDAGYPKIQFFCDDCDNKWTQDMVNDNWVDGEPDEPLETRESALEELKSGHFLLTEAHDDFDILANPLIRVAISDCLFAIGHYIQVIEHWDRVEKKPEPNEPDCRCISCDCTWFAEDLVHKLPDIPNLFWRIEPGGEVPAGQCNDCGALCYMIKP